mmetsp:Transcript_6291/g.20033  ORF Transcript_6291/g.20033 Transcript_6291/m.20033 type:complete len:746 (+) Transcript_6291:165-2402(+)
MSANERPPAPPGSSSEGPPKGPSPNLDGVAQRGPWPPQPPASSPPHTARSVSGRSAPPPPPPPPPGGHVATGAVQGGSVAGGSGPGRGSRPPPPPPPAPPAPPGASAPPPHHNGASAAHFPPPPPPPPPQPPSSTAPAPASQPTAGTRGASRPAPPPPPPPPPPPAPPVAAATAAARNHHQTAPAQPPAPPRAGPPPPPPPPPPSSAGAERAWPPRPPVPPPPPPTAPAAAAAMAPGSRGSSVPASPASVVTSASAESAAAAAAATTFGYDSGSQARHAARSSFGGGAGGPGNGVGVGMGMTRAGPPPSTTSAPRRRPQKRPRWGERTDASFEGKQKIGQGTYGEVYKARDADTGELVALKKVLLKNEKEGFPVTAVREIKLLRALNHPNIVRLRDIACSEANEHTRNLGSVMMVFEYCEYDLEALLDDQRVVLSPLHVKSFMKQLLQGLHYIHSHGVLHRDLKSANILVRRDLQLRIADWGLARRMPSSSKQHPLTNRVITLWYRAPELLLGARDYGPSVDMWSAGCVFGELLNRKPILVGNVEGEQIKLIWNLCGTPTVESWPAHEALPLWETMKPSRPHERRGQQRFSRCCPDPLALDLLDKMLALDPAKRITAEAALDHEYFWTDPLPPDDPSELPPLNIPDVHGMEAKRRRKQEAMARQDRGGRRIPAVHHVGTGAGAAASAAPGGVGAGVGGRHAMHHRPAGAQQNGHLHGHLHAHGHSHGHGGRGHGGHGHVAPHLAH